MAFIDENSRFDADTIESPVVGIAADVGKHDSGMHHHNKGQLLYAPSGCMSFTLEDSICILPPTKAVWIPPKVVHRASMTKVVAYRSLYFDIQQFECPNKITMIEVDDLLKALINKMAYWEWDKPTSEMKNITALFWEEFYAAKQHSFRLPLPTDRRLAQFRAQLTKDNFLVPQLNQLAQSVGASEKTVTRLFKAETGMSYQDWRQQWRLLKSIELLSRGIAVSEAAYQLEFSSDSAFIAFFKKQTGNTPLSFLRGNRSA